MAGIDTTRIIDLPTGARIELFARGEGPACVFLHGIGGHAGQWLPVTRTLGNGALLAWNARGYGNSSGPPITEFAAFADDLVALLDAVRLKRVLAVGHSMGGRILIEAALRHPQRFGALFLSGAQAAYLEHMSAEDRAAYVNARQGMFDGDAIASATAQKVARSVLAPGTPEDKVAAMAADFGRLNKDGFLNALSASAGWSRAGDLAGLDMPVTVMGGELDTVCPLAQTHEIAHAIGQGPATVLTGVGHMPQIEAPEVMTDLIAAFIEAHGARADTVAAGRLDAAA